MIVMAQQSHTKGDKSDQVSEQPSKAPTAMTIQSSKFEVLDMSDSDQSREDIMEFESASETDGDFERAVPQKKNYQELEESSSDEFEEVNH